MINYVKGDLFKLTPKNAYMLHACNCQGTWSAGIAKQFKDRYPEDFEYYKNFCNYKDYCFPGVNLTTPSKIICMFTSNSFGRFKDPEDKIIKNTRECLEHLHDSLPMNSVMYSPKINSGLFNVPWYKTEQLIEAFLHYRSDVKWTVVEYEQ